MSALEAIKKPVATELEKYEAYMREAFTSRNQLVQAMLDYIISTRGKAIRPLMVILSARINRPQGDLPTGTYLGAMLIEMIHTASLAHDDVIDEAHMRRGKPSVNALWHSRRAVLIGDYILARTFALGMQSGLYELVSYISGVMGEICEGELIQSDHSDRLDLERETYNDIIYKKTATLIGSSCGAGAMSVGAPPESVETMKRFGDLVGMAFQVKDDILDYAPSDKTGKPLANDLREKKINLPLLAVMENAGNGLHERIIHLLSNVNDDESNVEALTGIVLGNGGIEQAENVMNAYISEAKIILESFPDSIYRQSMSMLCDYIAKREY